MSRRFGEKLQVQNSSNMLYIVCFNSPEHGGGVEQVVDRLLPFLSAKLPVQVLCSTDSLLEGQSMHGGVTWFNMPVRGLGALEKTLRLSRLHFAYKVYKYLRKHGVSGDVVNVHGHEYSFFLRIFRYQIPANIKLVVTVHGSYFDAYTEWIVSSVPLRLFMVKTFLFVFRWYYYVLERACINNVDNYTFITSYLQTFYTKAYKMNRRSSVIYNGIDGPSQFQAERAQKAKDTLVAIIVGSSVLGKGLDIAISVVKRLRVEGKNLTLTIVGFPDFKKSYPRSIEGITYIGRVAPDKVRDFYATSDFLLFPSRNEGFPMTILEALQYGLPCVVSKNCKSTEIRGFDLCGIIVPDFSVVTWIDAVRPLFEPEVWARYHARAIEVSKEACTWGTIAEKYLSVLKSAGDRTPPSPER
jgi:glycosyltransferase involved in cell wall biosynthesis